MKKSSTKILLDLALIVEKIKLWFRNFLLFVLDQISLNRFVPSYLIRRHFHCSNLKKSLNILGPTLVILEQPTKSSKNKLDWLNSITQQTLKWQQGQLHCQIDGKKNASLKLMASTYHLPTMMHFFLHSTKTLYIVMYKAKKWVENNFWIFSI